MDLASAFSIPEKTIRFAKKAASELEAEVRHFLDFSREDEFGRLFVESNADTGEKIQKLKILRELPEDVERKATEALNNARHSFDQSLNAACSLLRGRPTKLHYPWADTLKDLDGRLKNPDIDPRLYDTIRAHEPYRTPDGDPLGNDLVRVLATVANGKHTLGLRVGGAIGGFKFAGLKGSVKELGFGSLKWGPDKNEAEVMRWVGELEVSPDYEFTFYVRLTDARLPESVDIIFALEVFTAKADEVCQSLKAKCSELGG